VQIANLNNRAGLKVNSMIHLRLPSSALATFDFPEMRRTLAGSYRLYQLYRSYGKIAGDHLDPRKMPPHLTHFMQP
jgi:hypothetical protein